jgi:hypothetical protein
MVQKVPKVPECQNRSCKSLAKFNLRLLNLGKGMDAPGLKEQRIGDQEGAEVAFRAALASNPYDGGTHANPVVC